MTTPSAATPPSRRPPAWLDLARSWQRALGPTGFCPLPRAEFEELVADQVAALADGLIAGPVTTLPAHRAGGALVDACFTDAESLRAILRVLTPGLLALAEADGLPDPVDRVSAVL